MYVLPYDYHRLMGLLEAWHGQRMIVTEVSRGPAGAVRCAGPSLLCCCHWLCCSRVAVPGLKLPGLWLIWYQAWLKELGEYAKGIPPYYAPQLNAVLSSLLAVPSPIPVRAITEAAKSQAVDK